MKYTFLGFGLIMAGLIGIVFIVMFESITINNESEYYVLKEAMEASMLESVDMTCYRNEYKSEETGCGEKLKISEQKFVENFTRRFAASINGDVTQYKIEFYDIIESPPKATVVIKGKTQKYSILNDNSFSIVNNLDGILEYWKPIPSNVDNDVPQGYQPIEKFEQNKIETDPSNNPGTTPEQDTTGAQTTGDGYDTSDDVLYSDIDPNENDSMEEIEE